MKDLNQIKNKIKLLDYIKSKGLKVKNIGNNSFRINPCPVCGHKNHFTINDNENYYQSFSGCCKGGDILNYMQEIEGLSFKEAKEELFKITNTPIETLNKEKINNKINFIKQEPKKDIQRREDTEKIKNFVTINYNKMEYKKELIDYLETRNINKEAIEKYHLFIALDNNIKRLYIPIFKNKEAIGYIGRLIKDTAQKVPRYKNSTGTIEIFNIDYLKEKILQEEKIYICEGVFDAISIEEQGGKAISLNSTSNTKKLIEEIKDNLETARNYFYIIATDNDDSGKKAKKELQEELTKLDIKNTYLKIPEEYKDINEWYCNVQKECKEIVSDDAIYNKYKEKYTTNYLQDYLRDIERFATYPTKKTGFNKLDDELDGGIKSGLYIIGAVPSLGKTTFTLQIADNIAEQGQKVIIFSLEQSKFELITKSISRLTYSLKGKNGITEAIGHNRIIKDKEIFYNKSFIQALVYYHDNIAKNQIIEEGNFNTNVDNIRDYIKDYIAVTNERPTIIIDYLQIISPSNTNLSDKQQIEHNVTTLKQISRDYNIPILVISSFNRMNYNQSASFEAFKESGGIEYTADILLTLQLKILSIQKNITNDDVRNAKKETPRKVEVICLKNRNGKSSFNIDLNFYPAFNIFKDNIV